MRSPFYSCGAQDRRTPAAARARLVRGMRADGAVSARAARRWGPDRAYRPRRTATAQAQAQAAQQWASGRDAIPRTS
jgi:hypothetical protein